MTVATTVGRFSAVTDDNGGAAIKARRLALGMSVRSLASLADVDRGQLAQFEAGKSHPQAHWVSRVVAAMDRAEAETEPTPAPETTEAPASPIRLTFHDVYGIGEIIAEAPGDQGDELVAAVVKLLAEIRAKGGQADQ